MIPKISIIVPVYNVEKYLSRCINSILSQSFTDFELILVDDGSSDNCGIICDDYALKDNRIKVIHKENGGLSSARNAGLNIAKGTHIGFIDSDDYIDQNMYEVMYNTAKKHSSDIVICHYYRVSEDGVFLNLDSDTGELIDFSNLEALNRIYDSESGIFVFATNKIFSNRLFENIRFADGRIFEDEFIAHELLFKSEKITILPNKFYYYVQRENSIVNSSSTYKKLDRVYALKERIRFFQYINNQELIDKAIKAYIDVFFWNYYLVQRVNNNDNSLEILYNQFNSLLLTFLKNKALSWKQKLVIVVFSMSPKIHQRLLRKS